MRRVFLGVVALVCFAMSAHATSTVTGTFVDGHGIAVTSRAYGLFELKGCNGNIPRVAASGVVVPPSVKVTPDGTGAFSQALYKTSEIDCGGQTSVTTWDFSLYYDGRKLYTYNFTINTASFDVNSATPNSVAPTITAPTGDSTYLRLDGGNQYQGSFVPSANNLYNLGSAGGRWATGYFVALNYSGQLTSSVVTGTAPFVVSSTTAVANLNASLLLGSTWASPAAIGSGTPAAGTFTTVTGNTSVSSASFISTGNANTKFTTSSRDITLTSADGSVTDGGDVAIVTGAGSGSSHRGGNINISTGAGGSANNGGNVTLTLGAGGGTIPGTGGGFEVTGGGGRTGGNITLTPGTGSVANGGIVLNGRVVTYNSILTVGDGIPYEVATVDATAQTAAITTTTLYTTTASQQFRLSWNAKVTTAAGVSSTLGALTIVYTDPDGVVQTITAGAQTNAGAVATTSAGNSTTTVLIGLPMMLNCKTGTNITYAFAYASNAANAMGFNLHLKLEAM